jgi:enoyl-CoA hydratase
LFDPSLCFGLYGVQNRLKFITDNNFFIFAKTQILMSFENLIYQVSPQGVLNLTLNRESKLNALNTATIAELSTAFTTAAQDAQIKAVLLTGSGPKAFAAGADISEFSGLNEQQGREFAQRGQAVFSQIEQMTKPVVAAVNGFALGGGCELAMACHLRLASTNAKFGQPEVNLGLIPGYGGTQRLTRLIGRGKALELMLTADMIDANQALSLGLVNGVYEPAELLGAANAMLEKILSKAPLAVAAVLRSVEAFCAQGESYSVEAQEFGKCCTTEDFKEGVLAFSQKRKAEFKGL